MPEKYLTIDGVATLIHHRGPTTLPGSPPDTSRGATIMCCHDAGTDGNQFADLMDDLANHHSPIAFDQPGHGRSANLDSLGSIDAMVTHLKAMADCLAVTDPVLVGEGLGAAVALQAAASHPDWVKAVIVTGDAAASYDLADEIARLTAITSGKSRRKFDRSGYAPDTDKSVYRTAFANWVRTDPRATLGDRQAQAAWSLGSPPSLPALVVVGAATESTYAEEAEALAGQLPNADLVVLDGAGRRAVLEQPEELGRLIDAFLTNLGDGGRS